MLMRKFTDSRWTGRMQIGHKVLNQGSFSWQTSFGQVQIPGTCNNFEFADDEHELVIKRNNKQNTGEFQRE